MAWRIHPISAYADHADSWRALNRAGGGTPLLDPLFVGPLIDAFAGGDEVLAVLEEGGTPTAMGLFARTGRFAWQTFQPANAPIGLWVCDPAIPVAEVLDRLSHTLPGISLVLGLTQQDPDFLPRQPQSGTVRTFDYIDTARITAAGSFDDYWKSRGKNLRHNIKRQTNRLRRDGVHTRLETLTAPDDMARAVADYSRLEVSGWKGRVDTAVRVEDPQGRFYQTMLQNFADIGETMACRYYFNEKLVASDLCIYSDGILIVLKTAYDESEQSISPAQLMRHELFGSIFNKDGFRKIEFYGPVKDWHTKWTDEIRTMYHMNLYRWPVVARLHGSLVR